MIRPIAPFFAVGADIDDGAREAVVLHAGHGNQELVVEKAAPAAVFLCRKKSITAKRNAFPKRLKRCVARDLPEAGANRVTARNMMTGQPSEFIARTSN